MVEIELPEEIQQLLQSCNDNCNEVERRALDAVSSLEVPVFNVLRDISARNCYMVLCHIPKWFGPVPTIEHCTCLMVLTEFVSCSYNNTNFYDTFVKEKQDKFYETFFVKLTNAWKKVFHKLSCKEYTLDQYISLKKSLKTSFYRFSDKFTYKWMLDEVLKACYEYGDKLRKFLSKSPTPIAVASTNEMQFIPNKTISFSDKKAQFDAAVLSAISKTIVNRPAVIGSDKTAQKSFHPLHRNIILEHTKNFDQPVQALTNYKTSADVTPVIVKPIQSSQKVEVPGMIKLQPRSTVTQPTVIVIDDSPPPAKIRCKPFAKEGNRPNFLLSKTEAKQSEFDCKNFLPFKSIENACGADQKNVNLSSKPKVLNAFDILMRRSIIKKKNIA